METKILLFNKWDLSEVKVEDPGLRKYINLDPIIVPRTGGRYAPTQIHKNKINIVERFINKLMVPGHRGKKHKLTSGGCPANTETICNAVKKSFILIEQKTRLNPVQVLVKAIENSALLEEIASYRLGGIIARDAVIVSPQRRLDISLRFIAQGIYKASFRSRKKLEEVIADELLGAYNNNPKTFSIMERDRIEKEAEGAR